MLGAVLPGSLWSVLGTGLLVGFLLATALLNLVAAFASQRRLHGCFALFVACTALRWFVVDGLAEGFLPGDVPLWPLAARALLGAQMVTGSLCQIYLLDLPRHQPWLLRYYQWCGIVPGLIVMLASASPWFDELTRLMFLLLLPAPLLSVPAYRRLWRDGSLAQRCIAVALPLHFLVMLPATLGNIGVLPFDPVYLTLARKASLPIILALHAGIGLKVRDIERERNAARVHEAQARVLAESERSAREEQARLLSVITHEVRTPIAVIAAAAHSLNLLEQDGVAGAAQREVRYRRIQQAVAHLGQVMTLTEAVDRLQWAPAAEAAADLLDLATLTAGLRSALEPAIASRVLIEAETALPALAGHARLIQVSLSNLLDNAIKYADPGTPIHIHIGCDPEQRAVVWRIRDVGPGIPEAQRERVFERYRRLEDGNGKPGLGLGLTLARQIIERHGGQLRLEAVSGPSGACFAAIFPLE